MGNRRFCLRFIQPPTNPPTHSKTQPPPPLAVLAPYHTLSRSHAPAPCEHPAHSQKGQLQRRIPSHPVGRKASVQQNYTVCTVSFRGTRWPHRTRSSGELELKTWCYLQSRDSRERWNFCTEGPLITVWAEDDVTVTLFMPCWRKQKTRRNTNTFTREHPQTPLPLSSSLPLPRLSLSPSHCLPLTFLEQLEVVLWWGQCSALYNW